MKADSPCKQDCPDRSAECHASCEKYAAYRAERANAYGDKRKIYTMVEYHKDFQRRYLKTKKKKPKSF